MTKKSSALSQHGPRRRAKNADIILTEKSMKELGTLNARKINLADKDAAEIKDWDKAVVGKFYRPIKKQITIRIDADTLDWFRSRAEKYQSLINDVCREYMHQHSKLSRKSKK